MNLKNKKTRRLLIFFGIFFNFGLGIVLVVLGWLSVNLDQGKYSDFSAFYANGLIIKDGFGRETYNVELQQTYQYQVLENTYYKGWVFPFVYPPHVALILVPFTIFSRQIAFFLWTFIQLLLLLCFIVGLRHIMSDWTSNEYWLTVSAIVASYPLLITFLKGAFSLVMLIFILKIYSDVKKGRKISAGLFFSMGLVKPQLLILPGFALLSGRQWKTILVAIIGGLLIFVSSSLLLGWNIWPDYFTFAMTMTGNFGSMGFWPEAMYNFRGMLTLLLGYGFADLINILSYLSLIGTIIIVVWIWNGRFNPQKPDFDLRMALTLLLGLLFNLHLYPHDSLILVAPAILFYNYLKRRGLPRGIYIFLALSFPSIFFLYWVLPGDSFILVPGMAMVGLVVWMVWALYKDHHLERQMTKPEKSFVN
jgi:hypothetical protein